MPTSWNQYKAQRNVGPDLDRTCLTLMEKTLIRFHILLSDLGLHCLPLSRKQDTRIVLIDCRLLTADRLEQDQARPKNSLDLEFDPFSCTLMVEKTHSVVSDRVYYSPMPHKNDTRPPFRELFASTLMSSAYSLCNKIDIN